MAEILIQGINVRYRDLRPDEEILYSNLPQDEQYFRRVQHPFSEAEIIEQSNISYEERASKYSAIQKAWVDKEESRMTYGNGVYALIDGELTYIPASYWGYINQWTLEDGEPIEYREPDRIVCIFFEYLCFETELLGLLRGKGRRMGATSLGFFLMWWICGRNKEKKGGSISYNDTVADKNFKTMFMRGFKATLPCFVRDFDSRAETFVRFAKASEKAKIGTLQKVDGLNSFCDYLANSINAYDSGRLSFGLFDETGKYEKTNINTFWSKVTPTLRKGKRKVGFAYMPSTVNPKNKGGENFKKFWNESNQNEINPNTQLPYGLNTPHKTVRYFQPATEGYAGCIDKFGRSVIDDPEVPVMGNDGEWITKGSRTIILEERALKEGEQLMEHRRDYPLDEHDMFAFETGACEFNEERIMQQIRWLDQNQIYLRKCRLYREQIFKEHNITGKKEYHDEIRFMDDDAGEWLLYEKPEKENLYDWHGSIRALNTMRYSIGVDTIKSGFSTGGSTATICVFKKSHIVNGIEEGLYPVALYMGKPRLMNHLYEQVLMACLWWGTKVNFEIDAGTSFYDYFVAKDALHLLEWTPRVAIDVTARKRIIKPGTESANPYQFAMQLEVAKKYFDGTLVGGYNGNVHRVVFPMMLNQALEYNHSDRTKSDIIISLMMALLPCFGTIEMKENEIPKRPKSILPTYKIEKYAY